MGKELGADKHQIDIDVEDILESFLVVVVVFFLVVYNRQVTGTDLGMDKHQILKIFCELFGWDGPVNKCFW